MAIVDSNVLVAILDDGHEHHGAAVRQLHDQPVTVTWGVLAEVAHVARRIAKANGMNGATASRRALANVRALAGFREARQPPLDEVLAMHAAQPRLSFVDAWNLVAALTSDEALMTFDRDLAAAYKRHHPTKS
ncbi:MAG: PIN domain-containing protein [bacterium]